MKLRLSAAVATVGALLASMTVVAVAAAPAQAQGNGFSVSGQQLLDGNGNPFIARGTSLPHVWYTQNSPAQFNNVANLGANAVRVVLGSGHQWGPSLDVGSTVNWCKQNEMICMLEVHDGTGFGEQSSAVSQAQIVNDYWGNQTVMDAVQGEERYVLVNIANEPRGNQNTGAWVNETTQAIAAMRQLGYTHTLVIDAPNWGQDWQFVMRDNAQQIAQADPLGNILFSIHMYEVFGSAQNVISYLDAFQQMNLPLVIGEFGWEHNGQPVAWQTILSQAQQRGIGWYAWSWSGNSGGAENLDQSVNFNPNNLTTWGNNIFNGTNGIAQTAQTATVYSGTTPPPPPPVPPPPPPPVVPPPPPPPVVPPPPPPPGPGDCAAGYTLVNEWPGGFQGEVAVTNTSSGTSSGWQVTMTFPDGQQVTQLWNGEHSQSGATATVNNAPWNGVIPPGGSVGFGFLGSISGANNAPTLTCTLS